jgi:hypothetical protein
LEKSCNKEKRLNFVDATRAFHKNWEKDSPHSIIYHKNRHVSHQLIMSLNVRNKESMTSTKDERSPQFCIFSLSSY